ncbi:succinylglutamate desuccinylase/aspartoacylase family protein [Microvirga splendida]|uniref:Succinylglutamate desuccinylase/aspartoacylase family protein n=1 Tax=Microvirga splendida TaxID=2795727 RepID=A0ABS0Y4T3_9HYPH|nr:succinylglutamate desuccinylase/aspartoacylase family protein [Microvirga splendida]MBJ6127303.1 succinylglutamate desuccinylase/aspartoacylase family protein [Microvirga splendida]
MRHETFPLPGTTPGVSIGLTVLRFGLPGAGPKVYIQAGLHADETPGHLTAHCLRGHLTALEEAGRIEGEIVLVPVANPIGLTQRLNGVFHGRFDMADGGNFNRAFPDLVDEVAEAVGSRLGQDGVANVALIRTALKEALARRKPVSPTEHLKHMLLTEAIDADVVLDIHCDSEAVVHLYTLTPQSDDFAPLAAYLGAKAMLLATESGDNPFDEAVSRPWLQLQERFPQAAIPLAGLATTLELRGESDVSDALAEADAQAILNFLTHRGVIAGSAPPVPETGVKPTPLAGSEPLTAPRPGIVVFQRETGERVETGDVMARLLDPVSGEETLIRSSTDGVFYARCSGRFAHAGKRLGKIAGTETFRHGKLLSP